MYNLLANGATLGYGVKSIASIDLNWIGQLIKILIEGIGIVGVGIIVFTLILKTIVLPLDIYSRVKTKKQALVMEEMRPQMEKLQKQYANDKNMYNQKVVELQKKSGYSAFGACLPMIVSILIFIIVFNAFSTYSQYANLESYNQMVNVYNQKIQEYVLDEDTPDGFLIAVEGDDYAVDFDAFTKYYSTHEETTLTTEEKVFLHLAEEYKKEHTDYDGNFDINTVNATGEDGELTETAVSIRISLVSFYLEEPAAQEVKLFYEGHNEKYEKSHNNGFLWIKNIWYPDSTLNKEVPDFSKFKSTVSYANISNDYEDSYNKVTAALETQKNSYNGYFILIILSIGLMLLQQWLSMRANKSVNDLSTVDGSGARTNKWMMIMMPIIYGIFSFFYSASFSIYMITNTLYGLITMLVINKAVDVSFKKKEEKQAAGKATVKKKTNKKK